MADRPQLGIVNFRAGTYVLIEGHRDSGRFFIIRQGEVQLSKGNTLVREDDFNSLHPGDFFGLVSAMSQHSQIESAQAKTDVVLISVDCSQFEGLIQYNTPIAMKIIQQFSRRMRYLNKALTDLTYQAGDEVDETSVLFAVGDFFHHAAQNSQASYIFKRYCQCYPDGALIEEAKKRLTLLEKSNAPSYTTGKTEFIRTYGSGNIIFAEGELGDELFIIQSGSVKITKIINGAEVILALLNSGDIFGEMAILESKPRSACAIAATDTTLMLVHQKNFAGMAATQPQIIARLTKLLAERIWFSYKQIDNAHIKDPVGRAFDNLLINLEKNNIPLTNNISYTFNFGPDELAKMAGIPALNLKKTISEMLQNKKFAIENNKIKILDIGELVKLSEYYKKMAARERGKTH
jgi:CRP-like cAMP-binding protein